MNKYGHLAMKHWQQYATTRYEELEDPEAFFTDLGQQIENQVWAIAEPLQRPILGQDLPYLEKVGAINATINQAEEIVLQELVYSAVTIEYSITEELFELLGELPGEASCRLSLIGIWMRITDAGGTPTEEDQAEIDQLEALLPLVSFTEGPGDWVTQVEALSEAEKTDLVLKLRPFWDPETHALVELPH